MLGFSQLGLYAVGQEIAFTNNAYLLTSAQGSYTLTGKAITMTSQRNIFPVKGSYVLTGKAAALGKSYAAFAVVQGSYTLTGKAITMTSQRKVSPVYGSYILTGFIGAVGNKWSVSQGTYALTGITITIFRSRTLAALYGTYALTGITLTLAHGIASITKFLRRGAKAVLYQVRIALPTLVK